MWRCEEERFSGGKVKMYFCNNLVSAVMGMMGSNSHSIFRETEMTRVKKPGSLKKKKDPMKAQYPSLEMNGNNYYLSNLCHRLCCLRNDIVLSSSRNITLLWNYNNLFSVSVRLHDDKLIHPCHNSVLVLDMCGMYCTYIMYTCRQEPQWRHEFHAVRYTFQVTAAWFRWSLNNKPYLSDCWQAAKIKLCINAVYSREPYMNNLQQARMWVMTLICALFSYSLSFNSLFSPQMKGVRPPACLPVPLSTAFNVSGKFHQPKQR